MNTTPLFSIVSVVRNDAWALSKTMRSVFRQSATSFEYIVVDSLSDDGADNLVDFWQRAGLVRKYIRERDTGVYDGMNKGARAATGEWVCFMNAGDTFASDDVLEKVGAFIDKNPEIDGVLGWGKLGEQLWASWTSATDAVRLASLGFCHQALFLKRSFLLKVPFDARAFKTDSDTLQLANAIAAGAKIRLFPDVLADRSDTEGISADLNRSKASILATFKEHYGLADEQAEKILAFRRSCASPEYVSQLLTTLSGKLRTHLAVMVLDTLFLGQSRNLPADVPDKLMIEALNALADDQSISASEIVESLRENQTRKATAISGYKAEVSDLWKKIDKLEGELNKILDPARVGQKPGDYVICFTSFPARIKSLYLVIESLLRQTVPPKAVFLTLGLDEFRKKSYLPRKLLALEPRGLQINLVQKTTHQYDKVLFASEINAQNNIVIVDDDVIYPQDSMQHLLEAHEQFPNCVIANRCHLIEVDEKGDPLPYEKWKKEVVLDAPSYKLIPTGVGGVLYPKGFLDPKTVDARNILGSAPYADDIWLKCCALEKGLPTKSTKLALRGNYGGWYMRYTPTMTAGALHLTNAQRGVNDLQMNLSLQHLCMRAVDWRSLFLQG